MNWRDDFIDIDFQFAFNSRARAPLIILKTKTAMKKTLGVVKWRSPIQCIQIIINNGILRGFDDVDGVARYFVLHTVSIWKDINYAEREGEGKRIGCPQ